MELRCCCFLFSSGVGGENVSLIFLLKALLIRGIPALSLISLGREILRTGRSDTEQRNFTSDAALLQTAEDRSNAGAELWIF
ncbi:hypothetical protein AMEX_G16149 [Astyanax mexicanus]|uniref:Uncharacterized protein n=1 Tax=Astyanax mexicanus TaxID=7994 RepID=A0A8T2LJY5_ASTMX|nr:hypothetical protein AMEX_G16149 [Astyanax mexicanus]